MKVEYDPANDLMNIEFLPGEPIAESMEVDGIIIDYTEDGSIVAIEILDAAKRTRIDPSNKVVDLSIVRESAAGSVNLAT